MKVRFALVLIGVFAAAAAHGQQADARWTPWLGCWQLTGESVRVCVEPYQGSGIRLTTNVPNGGAPVVAQTLVADGTQQPVSEADCNGWQQAEWSQTGERLFARAELSCRDGSTRRITGVSTIVRGTWIDIQGIDIAGRENIRVRRYVRVADQRLAPRLGSPLTLDEVKEASGRVSPRVLEAALVETGSGFTLTSDLLRDLDRAGVADNVIDTMVAISYPRHFVVERPSASGLGSIDDLALMDPYFGAAAFPYYSTRYGEYGYSPFLYSPFGYGYWGSYYPYGYTFIPGGTLVPVTVGPGAADGGSGDGRAVNGVGYTRIRSRSEVEAESAAANRRSGGGNGTSSTGAAARGGDSSTSSSSGSAGASPSGFSSGTTSSDSGRTAEPR